MTTRNWLVGLLALLPLTAQSAKPGEEVLRYSLNWPSGIVLGELTWSTTSPAAKAGASGTQWNSEMVLEAAIPAFPVRDSYRSIADHDLCAVEAQKVVHHGKRNSEETTSFDRAGRTAVRQTKGGGKTELSTGGCAHDALGFLNLIRVELAQGRIPASQTVYFGSPYQVNLEYGGEAKVVVAGKSLPADRLTGSIRGPASRTTFELFLSRDPSRTPLAARVPIPIGTLTLELVP